MKRRSFLATSGAGLAASGLTVSSPAREQVGGATFLVAHGAWSAGWVWRKMHPLLTASGHRLITPTYTGLGERAHLATPDVDLETHVQDMLGVIQTEELNDFVLIAHSYGGMVGTAVADRVPERIRMVIYLDAFAPRDGQSLLSLQPESAQQATRTAVKAGDGWRVSPSAPPPDTSPEDVKWINTHRVPHPLKCFDTPVKLTHGDTKMPRAYIYCLRKTPADTFRPFAERAKREQWGYHEIDASHSPHVTAPQALAALLDTIVRAA
jgi:pimeloyl-ACP methyl ester carboxylesterase